MDVAHVPSPAHVGVGISTGATSPPPRPAIPPKPDKDRIGSIITSPNKTTSSTQANFIRRFSSDASPVQCGRASSQRDSFGGGGIAPNFRSPIVRSSTDSFAQTTSPTPVLIPGNSEETSPSGKTKPALPPKPVNSSLLVSPPITKFPQKQSPKFPTEGGTTSTVENGNTVNNNGPTISPVLSNGEHNGRSHSPPGFLRAKPPPSPGDPLSPRIIPRSPGTRPNSSNIFNFSSPFQNLNTSTSAGLNQSGPGVTPPGKLAQIRVKSASLGRNITFPFSTPSSGGSGLGGIFSRKSNPLSKFLPLDLHIGSKQQAPPQPPAPNTRQKPNTLNLNPFIINQRKQQSQMHQQQVDGHPILNLGKSISFSPDSPLPPPPPPRLRRKLSPVNSIGSPTSPTSPTSSLPPPPVSPGVVMGMKAVPEVVDESSDIYAAVDKQKKWAERRLKSQMESPEAPLQKSSTSPVPISSQNNIPTPAILPDSKQVSEISNDKMVTTSSSTNSNSIPVELIGIDSFLGRYLQKSSTLPSTNPFRPLPPNYQPAYTHGNIYEPIGDDGNNNTTSKLDEDKMEIKEMSEPLPEDDLCDNKSFLFKLVISPKKNEAQPQETVPVDEAENLKEDMCSLDNEESYEVSRAPVQSSLTSQIISAVEQVKVASTPSPQQEENENEEVYHDAIGSDMIPTVVPDLSSPQTESNGKVIQTSSEVEGSISRKSSEVSELSKIEDVSFTSQTSSVPTTDSTVGSSTPSRTNSILRRRSWTCASPTLSDSSSTTSSLANNLPYHTRDRSYTGPNKIKGHHLQNHWNDEGQLSNGSLADAESSDVPLRSSAEDIIHFKGAAGISPLPASKSSFASRRSRLVSSIFGSFGKGSSSTSSTGSGGRKSTGMIRQNAKRKDRPLSHFFISDPITNYNKDGGSKFGRQISDSILPTTTMISGPILPSSASFPMGESGIPVHKPQSVQFSQEVSETRIIDQDQYSSDDPSGLGLPLPPPLEEGDRRDDESVSSSESASGSGSVSGYEDILADLSAKEKKGFYVAREILTSERTFVDVLNLLTRDFPKFLKTAATYHSTQILSQEDLNIILGGLPNLKRVNEDLLVDLEERVAGWRESPKIADILVKKGPFLKLYATYIKDFQKNSLHMDTCCHKYPMFAATMKEFEQGEQCQKLGLKHYMLKPVQRMPQYRLLLEDYLKSLDKDSEDYEDTVKGIAIVKEVAEHANEAIRLQVNAEKLLHLQNRLTAGTIILKADRQLLKEGELKKVSRKVLQPRFFALMNDCLLCLTYHTTTGSPKDLKLRNELPLAGMRVALSPQEDYQNEFSVISITRSFNLVATCPKERDEWMKALNNAIHDNIKKRTCGTPDQEMGFQLGKEAPLWVQDSRVTMCQLCTAEFTVTFRRHHCRACGKVVCGNCSGNQAPLQYLQNAAARVCDSCYECLLEEFDNLRGIANNDSDRNRASTRERFKKVTPNVSRRATKNKRNPARLEINANSSGSRISGYLHWRQKEKKAWKKRWFVLIDRVLYIYAASEDIVAIKGFPLLGWQVEMDKSEPQEADENMAVFKLTHKDQNSISFQTDSVATAEKWIAAMREAVVL